jgi:separase
MIGFIKILIFSPFILANLWDVTDKDIDTYIKGVLQDSDILAPRNSHDLNIEVTANQQIIIEKAQQNRQKCFLKALNGYAPVVYSLL